MIITNDIMGINHLNDDIRQLRDLTGLINAWPCPLHNASHTSPHDTDGGHITNNTNLMTLLIGIQTITLLITSLNQMRDKQSVENHPTREGVRDSRTHTVTVTVTPTCRAQMSERSN